MLSINTTSKQIKDRMKKIDINAVKESIKKELMSLKDVSEKRFNRIDWMDNNILNIFENRYDHERAVFDIVKDMIFNDSDSYEDLLYFRLLHSVICNYNMQEELYTELIIPLLEKQSTRFSAFIFANSSNFGTYVHELDINYRQMSVALNAQHPVIINYDVYKYLQTYDEKNPDAEYIINFDTEYKWNFFHENVQNYTRVEISMEDINKASETEREYFKQQVLEHNIWNFIRWIDYFTKSEIFDLLHKLYQKDNFMKIPNETEIIENLVSQLNEYDARKFLFEYIENLNKSDEQIIALKELIEKDKLLLDLLLDRDTEFFRFYGKLNIPNEIVFYNLKKNGNNIKFIENQTEEFQWAAIMSDDGSALEFIKNPTRRVIEKALELDGLNLKFVKAKLQDDELVKKALEQDGKAIQYVTNPSKYFKFFAVLHDGEAIKFIKNPMKDLQMLAVLENPKALNYIENPKRDVVKAVEKEKYRQSILYSVEGNLEILFEKYVNDEEM